MYNKINILHFLDKDQENWYYIRVRRKRTIKMKLKNYRLYLKKLKSYSKLCGIKVEFRKEVDGIGAYVPSRRSIVIETSLSQSHTISTLLHELGHFVDDFRNPNNHFNNRFHNDGRTAIENERALTARQKKKVLQLEREAWKNGRALARQLNIPLGRWFFQDEKSSFNTYRSIRIREED